MPRRPNGSQGGFDSRPVADAATSGDRRIDCMPTHAHRHGTAPVAFRLRNDVAPTNTETAPVQASDGTRPRPAPKGQGELVE